jgi:hypothetical protein
VMAHVADVLGPQPKERGRSSPNSDAPGTSRGRTSPWSPQLSRSRGSHPPRPSSRIRVPVPASRCARVPPPAPVRSRLSPECVGVRASGGPWRCRRGGGSGRRGVHPGRMRRRRRCPRTLRSGPIDTADGRRDEHAGPFPAAVRDDLRGRDLVEPNSVGARPGSRTEGTQSDRSEGPGAGVCVEPPQVAACSGPPGPGDVARGAGPHSWARSRAGAPWPDNGLALHVLSGRGEDHGCGPRRRIDGRL